MLDKAKIIKINSDTFTVKVGDIKLDCKSRGKFRNEKIRPLVGDNVLIDKEKLIIEKVLARNNYLLRPPVANIDIALIVTSIKEPDLNLTLLDKLISIVEINSIEPVIILTKEDLVSKEEIKKLKKVFSYYENIGIKVFENNEIKKIKSYLQGKIVTVCGQTGAGKSSLINKMNANLNLATSEISKALGRGKHTTRVVELYEIDDFYIVDTPGFSQIDLNIYNKDEIKMSFREWQNYECKFRDCNHIRTPNCGVIAALNNNLILASRYNNYVKFMEDK